MTIAAPLRIDEVEKAYGETPVLRGVSFGVEAGTIYALLGNNGAGKTTLVKIIATLLAPDAGRVSVAGADLTTEAAQVRKSLSWAGQLSAVDELLTGWENLTLIARLRHLPHPKVEAKEMLERFDLLDAGQRRVSTYSGGMLRRLDLAMSLLGSVPLLLLDEPTTGLDPKGRRKIWAAVRQLARNGTAVLLTTQYLTEAEELADMIGILDQGRLIAEGTLSDLQGLIPAPSVETVTKEPTLEDVFLSIVSKERKQP